MALESTLVETVASVGTAIATIALVLLLWRTLRQLEDTAKLSRVQIQYRFRPWIGPVGNIQKISDSVNGKYQFDITIKNYGELPATGVKAKFAQSTKIIHKDAIEFKKNNLHDLGPLMPNMEKHFWFFIAKELIAQTEEKKEKLYTALYFEYTSSFGKSGYGMISEYNPQSGIFVHHDMWVDDPEV